jgi:hypothetical protein
MPDFDEDALEAMEGAIAQLPPKLQKVAARLEPPVLHSASVAGEVDLVVALLDVGLAPDMYPCTDDYDDEPPLTWIARYRDKTSESALIVAKLLIERGAGVDEGLPLWAAAEVEDLPMMQLLLAAGADPALVFEVADPQEIHLIEQVVSQGQLGGH